MVKYLRREILARIALLLIAVGTPVTALSYQHFIHDNGHGNTRIISVEASIPENGGFDVSNVRVAAGEEVTLRFASTDVTHGVAIGPGLGIDLGHIDPGHVREVTLRISEPGTYTYYCTTWCSPYHWRMRGTIRVYDPQNPDAPPVAQPDPVILNLFEEGMNIDAVHLEDIPHRPELEFSRQPSLTNGGLLVEYVHVPDELYGLDWRRTHTPLEALKALETANPLVTRADLIDVTVYIWLKDYTQESLSAAETYYRSNCAACHGQTGAGDGPAANSTTESPIAFNDLTYFFTTRGDVLYAKIRRGGMGTDMPNFGTLMTRDETWRIVDYLRTLPFRESTQSLSTR